MDEDSLDNISSSTTHKNVNCHDQVDAREEYEHTKMWLQVI